MFFSLGFRLETCSVWLFLFFFSSCAVTDYLNTEKSSFSVIFIGFSCQDCLNKYLLCYVSLFIWLSSFYEKVFLWPRSDENSSHGGSWMEALKFNSLLSCCPETSSSEKRVKPNLKFRTNMLRANKANVDHRKDDKDKERFRMLRWSADPSGLSNPHVIGSGHRCKVIFSDVKHSSYSSSAPATCSGFRL